MGKIVLKSILKIEIKIVLKTIVKILLQVYYDLPRSGNFTRLLKLGLLKGNGK